MILTIGPGGCGFTFLNWSITYLTGADEYKTLDNHVVPVDINPIEGSIAHKFSKDHIQSFDDWHKLKTASQKSIVYLTPTHQQDIDNLIDYDCKKIIFQYGNNRQEYFARLCLVVPPCELLDMFDNLYNAYGVENVRQTLLDNVDMFTDYYFIPENFKNYQFIYYKDLFQNLDTTIKSIFNFLDFEIDQQRYICWKPIYFQWKNANQGFLTKFLDKPVEVDKTTKSLIIKELFKWRLSKWKVGQFRHI